jgi:AcrR family transcriptional regulator
MTIDRPLRADARRNRDALIAAARRVIERGEFFDLRFDDLADLAGVGTGTLYRHFPTREALAEAVYEEEIAALADRARHLGSTLPAHEALSAFVRDMVLHVREHEGLGRTLATLLATATEARATSSRPLEDAVAELVAAGVEEGSIRADVGPGTVMMALHCIGTTAGRPDWRAESDGLITLVLDGLRRR